MSGDFENWNTEPSHNKAPDAVNRKFARRDARRDTFWLAVKILVVLAGASILLWWGSR